MNRTRVTAGARTQLGIGEPVTVRTDNRDGPDSGPAHRTALLFDLDGTLVDSVYEHVLAWHDALEASGIDLSVWRIHRRMGMSGGLFVNALIRETQLQLGPEHIRRLQHDQTEAYLKQADRVRPLPGARELLRSLSSVNVPWAIATSSGRTGARSSLKLLGVGDDSVVITRDEVARAKPDPDLFLAAADSLGRRHYSFNRGRRQRLGHPGCQAGRGAWCRTSVWRLRPRRAGGSRRL